VRDESFSIRAATNPENMGSRIHPVRGVKNKGCFMNNTQMAVLAGMAIAIPAVAVDAQNIAEPVNIIRGTRLDVVARGSSKQVPDIAVISAGVVTQAPDAATAMAQNASRMTRVIAALRKAGVADKDMATSSISLSPQYRYAQNEMPVITGYQASNNLTIRFRDIGKSGAILDVLVKEGANQINGPTMTVDKPDAALDAARVSAIKAAQTRASLYATALGLKVKRVVSINESQDYAPQPMPMMMAARDASAEAKTEVLPGETSIGVTVSVVFELE
jgi:hypothetical protein